MAARCDALDYARLLAIFGVVLFHAKAPGGEIGHAGLPFFLLLLTLFVVPAASRSSLAEFSRLRAWRLLGPWLLWCGIYGALKVTDAFIEGRPLSTEFEPWMVLTGPAAHLWFLPFAFVVSVAAHTLVKGLSRWEIGAVALVVACAALAVFQREPLPQPLGAWAFALPAAALGLILSAAPRWWPLTLAFIGAAWVFGWTNGLPEISIALAVLLACLHLPLRLSAPRGLADVVMGVYLAHPLVASLQERLSPIPANTLTAAIVTMSVSLMLAYGMGNLGRMLTPEAQFRRS